MGPCKSGLSLKCFVINLKAYDLFSIVHLDRRDTYYDVQKIGGGAHL